MWILIALIVCLSTLSIVLFCLGCKEEKEEEERKEREYRPEIVFSLLRDDEILYSQVAGDDTEHSKLVIENIHPTKRALSVDLIFERDGQVLKKYLSDEYRSGSFELPPREMLKFDCHKLFPEAGDYSIHVRFKSELGHCYLTTSTIRCLDTPWKHWLIIGDPKTRRLGRK